MKLHQLLLLLVVLCIGLLPPVHSSDECLRCASNLMECRTGNVTTVQKCNPGQVCIADNTQNAGDIPYYVRGCDYGNRCSVMQSIHGSAYKFCETCEGDRCNNKVIGGANLSGLKCRFCAENSEECRTGKMNKVIQCVDGADHCYTEYIQNTGHQPYYRRGCGVGNRCRQQADNHRDALLYCDTCKEDECNIKSIGPANITGNMECLSCNDRRETCRTGEVTTVESCDKAQGYFFCIADLDNGMYRRGCSRISQCRGRALCKLCDSSKCNNESIGAKEKGVRTCYSCDRSYVNGVDCTGTSTEICEKGEKCIEYAYYYSSAAPARVFKGCAESCDSVDAYKVPVCRTCSTDLCNTRPIQLIIV